MKNLSLIFAILTLPLLINAQDTKWVALPGSSNWNTGTNWDNGVPNSSKNAIIPSSSSRWPNISGSVNCKSITFESGGSVYPRLTFSTSTGAALNVHENFTNNASKQVISTSGNGRVNFVGAATSCTLSGTTFIKKLQVNKTSPATGITVTSGSPEIQDWLLLSAGDLTLNSGTGLVLLSDVANETAAYIDVVTSNPTGVINGAGASNVTVSQYIKDWTNDPFTPSHPSLFNYRYFSSPITSSTWYTNFAKFPTNNLESDVEMIPWYDPLNSTFFDPETAFDRWYTSLHWPGNGTPGFYWYDEKQQDPNTPGDNHWYGYRGWTSSTTFANRLQGYLVHSKITQSDRTVKWTGTVNNAPTTALKGEFYYTNHGESADGLNIAGNPFPSPLDWSAVYFDGDNSNFNPTITIWRNVGSITNEGWAIDFNPDDPESTPDFDGILAIGQGFFLRSTVDDNELSIKNEHRTAGLQVTHWRKAIAPQPDGFGLRLLGGSNPDQVFFRYSNAYESAFNPKKDVSKVTSEHQSYSMFSKKEGKAVSIQYFKTPEIKTEIPMELKIAKSGSYTIHSFNVSEGIEGYQSYLVDKMRNNLIKIEPGMEYTFQTEGGQINQRFSVVTAKSTVKANELLGDVNFKISASLIGDQIKIWFYNTTASSGFVSLSDLSGKVLKSGNLTLTTESSVIEAPALKTGVYIVKVEAEGKSSTQKLFVY